MSKNLFCISAGELVSCSRKHHAVNDRATPSWIDVKELGYSDAEVVRHLGSTNSCGTQIASAGKALDVVDFIRKL